MLRCFSVLLSEYAMDLSEKFIHVASIRKRFYQFAQIFLPNLGQSDKILFIIHEMEVFALQMR